MGLFSWKAKSVVVAKTCSACGETLAEHPQVDVASAPVGSEDDARLTALIAEHRWAEARRYQAANATEDIRMWRMIRCRDGRVGVVARVMPFEIWSDDHYEEPQFLSDGERDRLLTELA